MKTITRYLPFVLLCFLFFVGITVSCSKKEEVVPKSTAKAITDFGFNALSPVVAGSISGNSIAATVPFSVDVTTLVPTLSASSKATVSPASGVAQNFSNPITYTVTAEDGSTATYTVTVTKSAAPKSAAKDITAFAFNALSPAVAGVIDNTAKTISATVAAGTDATKLVPTITTSAKATVSPATGVAQDFSKPVAYAVTAEDGSTQTYSVTVTVPKPAVATTITIRSSNELPDVLKDLGDGVDYIVTTNLAINGTRVVTVEPGVRIQFDGGSSGFSLNNQAALKMIGTAAKPIVLEGKVASAGSWQGLRINSNNIENMWEYVTLKHAGGGSDKAGLWLNGIDTPIRLSLKNCTFSDNTGYGIYDDDDFFDGNHLVGFESNTFTNNTKSALKIRVPEMGSLDGKSSYANNGQKYIEVGGTSVVPNSDITVQKLGVPYRILNSHRLTQKITISAGTTLEFLTDVGFDCRYGDKQSAIVANGTAADPIRFVGYLPNVKGLWKGFVLENGNVETSFTNCIIDGAGSVTSNPCSGDYKSALSFGANPCGSYPGRGTVSKCTISNSGGYAIVFKTDDPVTVSDNTYAGNLKENVFNYK